MATKDWLPTTHAGQLEMAQNWMVLLGCRGQAWSVPDEAEKNLESLTEEARDTLHDAWQSERTAATNQKVLTAFGALTDHMRDLRRRHF